MPAMRNTGHCRSWIFWAFVPAGCHVSCGASLAHPASSTSAAEPTTADARRPVGRRRGTLATLAVTLSAPRALVAALVGTLTGRPPRLALSTPGTMNAYGALGGRSSAS